MNSDLLSRSIAKPSPGNYPPKAELYMKLVPDDGRVRVHLWESPFDRSSNRLEAVRRSTISLFANLPEAALMRSGVADGKRSTVRVLCYHVAGHECHHVRHIRDRYLA